MTDSSSTSFRVTGVARLSNGQMTLRLAPGGHLPARPVLVSVPSFDTIMGQIRDDILVAHVSRLPMTLPIMRSAVCDIQDQLGHSPGWGGEWSAEAWNRLKVWLAGQKRARTARLAPPIVEEDTDDEEPKKLEEIAREQMERDDAENGEKEDSENTEDEDDSENEADAEDEEEDTDDEEPKNLEETAREQMERDDAENGEKGDEDDSEDEADAEDEDEADALKKEVARLKDENEELLGAVITGQECEAENASLQQLTDGLIAENDRLRIRLAELEEPTSDSESMSD